MAFRNPVTTLPASGITAGTLGVVVDVGPGGMIRAGDPAGGRTEQTQGAYKLYGPDGVTVLVDLEPAGVTVKGRVSSDDPTIPGTAYLSDGTIGFTDVRSNTTDPPAGGWPSSTTTTVQGPVMTRGSHGELIVSGRRPHIYADTGASAGYRVGAAVTLDSSDGASAPAAARNGSTLAKITADQITLDGPVDAFVAPGFRPQAVAGTSSFTTTATGVSYNLATMGQVDFTAPPSGAVRVSVSGFIHPAGAGQSCCLQPEVKQSGATGSAVVHAANTNESFANYNAAYVRGTSEDVLVTGLVPGGTYTAYPTIYCSVVGAVGTSFKTTVTPVG